MKIAVGYGAKYENKTAPEKVSQVSRPGRISKSRKRARSLGLFKSEALPTLR